ncbi:hypothetical protein O0L34_g2325 [Tuta absoluta]|nr:hypothetical protein O0L34_g2325 [Tuta absoluta]
MIGSYCCIARNCMGSASSSAELTVEDIQNQLNEEEKLQLFAKNQAPKFVQGLKSVEAKIDEPFRFTIKVQIPPEPAVMWYRDDQPVDESTRCKLAKEDRGVFYLDISNLEFIDQAEWKCVANNDFGHSVTSCFLKLIIPRHYKKPRFLENLQAILSDEGAVNLECKVIGVPQPVLKWYKDGEELKPGDIHRIISGQDGSCCLGTYTCEARNCMGIAASSASLLGFDDSMKAKKKKVEEQALQRNLSLSTIHEERTSQMYDTPVGDITLDDKGEISFSFDGKEVSVSLYETPDLTEEEALQIVEMYADQLSENVTEHNVVELPPLRFVKETSTSGNLLMEAIIIDVSPEYFVAPEEDLRTEADVEDISIADENGPPQLSLDADIEGEDYLEKTMAILSEERSDVPKVIPRKKSDSAKSGEDFFSLSRDPSLVDDKRDDDTQVSESFASARSASAKAKSKSSKQSDEDFKDILEPFAARPDSEPIVLKEVTQKHSAEPDHSPVVKPKRERRTSRGSRRSSSGSEKSLRRSKDEPRKSKEREEPRRSKEKELSKKIQQKDIQKKVDLESDLDKSKQSNLTDDEFKCIITNVSFLLSKIINDVQIIERDIILKSELMSSAATASRSLEIISNLIKPLSEIHSIADAIKDSESESKEITSSIFNNLPQPLKFLQQTLTIIEKCIEVESESKTLIKRTCVAFVDACGNNMQKLMSELSNVAGNNYVFIQEKTKSDIHNLTKEASNALKSSADFIKNKNLSNEGREEKIEESSEETKHLRNTQKAVFELKSPLNSLLCIAESADSGKMVDVAKVKHSEVILTDMSGSIQDLQTALEQIESLSVKESTTSLYKYNTEIIETVMESVLKLRSSFEQLSTETKSDEDFAVLMKVISSIKLNLIDISSHIDTIERNVGTFDILQSENKLEVLQKMAQILIALENNLQRLNTLPTIKFQMDIFHKNLTKVLENIIESNDAKKYFILMEICDAVNRMNSSIKNIDVDNVLSLASLGNTLSIIRDYFVKNVFEPELNCSILNNIADTLVGIQEAINHAEENSMHVDSEHIEEMSANTFDKTKANVIIEHIDHTIAAISNVKSMETTLELKTAITPVLETIYPVLEDLKHCIAAVKQNKLEHYEHISEMSETSLVQTLATPICELNQNIITLNQIMIENLESLQDSSAVVMTVAEPLHELFTTLEVLQQDVISQYGENVNSYEISVNIASAVQNLHSCILMIQEQAGVEIVDEMSTLEDISGIKTTADTIPLDRLVLPTATEVEVEQALKPFGQDLADTVTAQALQSLNEHITVLQTPEIIDALDSLSEISDFSSLRSIALGLGELHAGLKEILHPIVMETSEDVNLLNTNKLTAIAEPMQELQQSLSILDMSNIPVYEHILELPTERIHSVLQRISEFKSQLDKCITAVFPAMETAEKTIEISNKVETLRGVCENLKDIIKTSYAVSHDAPVNQEVILLEETVNNLLDATDVSKGIKIENVKAITEKLYENILNVQEEIIQYTPKTSEKISYEAQLVQTIDEIESNIAVLEQYEFVDLSRASDITSCTSPQLAMELDSESLLQMDDIVENAVNVVQDSTQDTPMADLMIIEDFFKSCKSEFTILRCLMTKQLSHKKIIRILQEFLLLQSTINDFRRKRSDLRLSDDIDSYLTTFLIHADDCLKNVQESLIKIVQTQSTVLFGTPKENLQKTKNTLKNVSKGKISPQIAAIAEKFDKIIDATKEFVNNAETAVIEELKDFSNVSYTQLSKDVSEKIEEITAYLEEVNTKIPEVGTKEAVEKILHCLHKHEDYKDAVGTGKLLIIVKCLSECSNVLQESITGIKQKVTMTKPHIEESGLKGLLTEMLEPLQALHSQLIGIEEQVLSGVEEDLLSVDVPSTESLVQTMTEIQQDIEQVNLKKETINQEEIFLIMEVNKEIHSIQDSIQSMADTPVAQIVKDIAKPIEAIEESLHGILSAEKVPEYEKKLSAEKSKELVQQIDQYIELIEIVEEVSVVIKMEDLKDTADTARELRESIVEMDPVPEVKKGAENEIKISLKQSGLAHKLQTSVKAIHVQMSDSAQELAPALGTDVLKKMAQVTAQLQTDLVAISGIEVPIETSAEIMSAVVEPSCKSIDAIVSENTQIVVVKETHPETAVESPGQLFTGDKSKVSLQKNVEEKIIETEATMHIIGEPSHISEFASDHELISEDKITKASIISVEMPLSEFEKRRSEEHTTAFGTLLQHIEEYLSVETVEAAQKLCQSSDIETLKQLATVAQKLHNSIKITQEEVEGSVSDLLFTKDQQDQAKQLAIELQETLKVIQVAVLDTESELISDIDRQTLQHALEVMPLLQEDINAIITTCHSPVHDILLETNKTALELENVQLETSKEATAVETIVYPQEGLLVLKEVKSAVAEVEDAEIQFQATAGENIKFPTEQETKECASPEIEHVAQKSLSVVETEITSESVTNVKLIAHESVNVEPEIVKETAVSQEVDAAALEQAVFSDTLLQHIDEYIIKDVAEFITNLATASNNNELMKSIEVAQDLKENIIAGDAILVMETCNALTNENNKSKQVQLAQQLQSALLSFQHIVFENAAGADDEAIQKALQVAKQLQSDLNFIVKPEQNENGDIRSNPENIIYNNLTKPLSKFKIVTKEPEIIMTLETQPTVAEPQTVAVEKNTRHEISENEFDCSQNEDLKQIKDILSNEVPQGVLTEYINDNQGHNQAEQTDIHLQHLLEFISDDFVDVVDMLATVMNVNDLKQSIHVAQEFRESIDEGHIMETTKESNTGDSAIKEQLAQQLQNTLIPLQNVAQECLQNHDPNVDSSSILKVVTVITQLQNDLKAIQTVEPDKIQTANLTPALEATKESIHINEDPVTLEKTALSNTLQEKDENRTTFAGILMQHIEHFISENIIQIIDNLATPENLNELKLSVVVAQELREKITGSQTGPTAEAAVEFPREVQAEKAQIAHRLQTSLATLQLVALESTFDPAPAVSEDDLQTVLDAIAQLQDDLAIVAAIEQVIVHKVPTDAKTVEELEEQKGKETMTALQGDEFGYVEEMYIQETSLDKKQEEDKVTQKVEEDQHTKFDTEEPLKTKGSAIKTEVLKQHIEEYIAQDVKEVIEKLADLVNCEELEQSLKVAQDLHENLAMESRINETNIELCDELTSAKKVERILLAQKLQSALSVFQSIALENCFESSNIDNIVMQNVVSVVNYLQDDLHKISRIMKVDVIQAPSGLTLTEESQPHCIEIEEKEIQELSPYEFNIENANSPEEMKNNITQPLEPTLKEQTIKEMAVDKTVKEATENVVTNKENNISSLECEGLEETSVQSHIKFEETTIEEHSFGEINLEEIILSDQEIKNNIVAIEQIPSKEVIAITVEEDKAKAEDVEANKKHIKALESLDPKRKFELSNMQLEETTKQAHLSCEINVKEVILFENEVINDTKALKELSTEQISESVLEDKANSTEDTFQDVAIEENIKSLKSEDSKETSEESHIDDEENFAQALLPSEMIFEESNLSEEDKMKKTQLCDQTPYKQNISKILEENKATLAENTTEHFETNNEHTTPLESEGLIETSEQSYIPLEATLIHDVKEETLPDKITINYTQVLEQIPSEQIISETLLGEKVVSEYAVANQELIKSVVLEKTSDQSYFMFERPAIQGHSSTEIDDEDAILTDEVLTNYTQTSEQTPKETILEHVKETNVKAVEDNTEDVKAIRKHVESLESDGSKEESDLIITKLEKTNIQLPSEKIINKENSPDEIKIKSIQTLDKIPTKQTISEIKEDRKLEKPQAQMQEIESDQLRQKLSTEDLLPCEPVIKKSQDFIPEEHFVVSNETELQYNEPQCEQIYEQITANLEENILIQELDKQQSVEVEKIENNNTYTEESSKIHVKARENITDIEKTDCTLDSETAIKENDTPLKEEINRSGQGKATTQTEPENTGGNAGLLHHIEEFISEQMSVADDISVVANTEQLKVSVALAKDLIETIAASETLTSSIDTASESKEAHFEQVKQVYKLQEALTTLQTEVLDSAQDINPYIDSKALQRISDAVTHLQEDLAVAIVCHTSQEVKIEPEIVEENSMKHLVELLQEVNEKINTSTREKSIDDTETLRDSLDEVQTVIIKLKRDCNVDKNDTLNETLDDLECSVRSVQLQINEDSPPELLKEACATLQLLANNMSDTQEVHISGTIATDVNTKSMLEKCSQETNDTVKLLNAVSKQDTKDLSQLSDIVSCLTTLKNALQSLKSSFSGDAETLIEKGVDVVESLNHIEDKVFLLEKDVENEKILGLSTKENILTAVHSIYSSISNMRSTISTIQRQYMYESYGKPSERLLLSIKNINAIVKSEVTATSNLKKVAKSIRSVLNHFEDVKFYVNLDKTARLPSDAAFTKIVLEELKLNINNVIVPFVKSTSSMAIEKCDKTLKCLQSTLVDIEPKSTLDVKEKIPIFKQLASHVLNLTNCIKVGLENELNVKSETTLEKNKDHLEEKESADSITKTDKYSAHKDTTEKIISDEPVPSTSKAILEEMKINEQENDVKEKEIKKRGSKKKREDERRKQEEQARINLEKEESEKAKLGIKSLEEEKLEEQKAEFLLLGQSREQQTETHKTITSENTAVELKTMEAPDEQHVIKVIKEQNLDTQVILEMKTEQPSHLIIETQREEEKKASIQKTSQELQQLQEEIDSTQNKLEQAEKQDLQQQQNKEITEKEIEILIATENFTEEEEKCVMKEKLDLLGKKQEDVGLSKNEQVMDDATCAEISAQEEKELEVDLVSKTRDDEIQKEKAVATKYESVEKNRKGEKEDDIKTEEEKKEDEASKICIQEDNGKQEEAYPLEKENKEVNLEQKQKKEEETRSKMERQEEDKFKQNEQAKLQKEMGENEKESFEEEARKQKADAKSEQEIEKIELVEGNIKLIEETKLKKPMQEAEKLGKEYEKQEEEARLTKNKEDSEIIKLEEERQKQDEDAGPQYKKKQVEENKLEEEKKKPEEEANLQKNKETSILKLENDKSKEVEEAKITKQNEESEKNKLKEEDREQDEQAELQNENKETEKSKLEKEKKKQEEAKLEEKENVGKMKSEYEKRKQDEDARFAEETEETESMELQEEERKQKVGVKLIHEKVEAEKLKQEEVKTKREEEAQLTTEKENTEKQFQENDANLKTIKDGSKILKVEKTTKEKEEMKQENFEEEKKKQEEEPHHSAEKEKADEVILDNEKKKQEKEGMLKREKEEQGTNKIEEGTRKLEAEIKLNAKKTTAAGKTKLDEEKKEQEEEVKLKKEIEESKNKNLEKEVNFEKEKEEAKKVEVEEVKITENERKILEEDKMKQNEDARLLSKTEEEEKVKLEKKKKEQDEKAIHIKEAENLKLDEEKRKQEEETKPNEKISEEEDRKLKEQATHKKEEAKKVKLEEEKSKREVEVALSDEEKLKSEKETELKKEKEVADKLQLDEEKLKQEKETERKKEKEVADKLKLDEENRKHEEKRKQEKEAILKKEKEEAENLRLEEEKRKQEEKAKLKKEYEEAEKVKLKEAKLKKEAEERKQEEEAKKKKEKEDAEKVQLEEEKRKQEKEAKLKKEQAEKLKLDEETRKQEEEAKHKKAKEEAEKRKQEEEAKMKKEKEDAEKVQLEEEIRKQEKEAKLKKEEAEKLKLDEEKRKQEEEAKHKKAKEEAEKRKQEEEAKMKKEKEDAEKVQLEEEIRKQEKEAKLKKEEAEKLKLDEEKRKQEEEEKHKKAKEEAEKRKQEEEAKMKKEKEDAEKVQLEEDIRKQEKEAKLKKEEAEKLKLDEKKRKQEEEEKHKKAKEEAEKRKQEEEAKMKKEKEDAEKVQLEEEKRKQEKEAKLKKEEAEKLKLDEEKRKQEEEAKHKKTKEEADKVKMEVEKRKQEKKAKLKKEETEKLKLDEEKRKQEEEGKMKKEKEDAEKVKLEEEKKKQEKEDKLQKEKAEILKLDEEKRKQETETKHIKVKEEAEIRKKDEEANMKKENKEAEKVKFEEEKRQQESEAKLKIEEAEKCQLDEEKRKQEKEAILKKEEAEKKKQEEEAQLTKENDEAEKVRLKEEKRIQENEKTEKVKLEEEKKREQEEKLKKEKLEAEKKNKEEKMKQRKENEEAEKLIMEKEKRIESEKKYLTEQKRKQEEETMKRSEEKKKVLKLKDEKEQKAEKEKVVTESKLQKKLSREAEKYVTEKPFDEKKDLQSVETTARKPKENGEREISLDRRKNSEYGIDSAAKLQKSYEMKSSHTNSSDQPRIHVSQSSRREEDYDLSTTKRKYEDREKPAFIEHNHRDYTMEFARPSGYREKTFDEKPPVFERDSRTPIIYKAHTLVLDSQLRSSLPPPAEDTRRSHPERRSEIRHKSKAASEARSVLSEKRSSMPRDIKRKPVFSTYLTDRTAVEGSRVKLTCSVLSSSDPTVTWYKNGVVLDNKLKYRTKLVNGLITLEVLNAVPSDSAEYICTVENENGSVSSSANLKVYPSFEASPIPPTFTRSIRDTYHLAENELVLECRIRGQPLPTITWMKDDKLISSNERYEAFYLADGVCRLAISHPTPADSGKYTCKAENSVWSDQISHVVNFTGNESRLSPNIATIERSRFNRQAMESRRPHFANVLNDYKVARGGTIGLQVEIRGDPTRVEWLREGRSVTEVYRNAKTFVEQDLYTLALSDVTEKESGLYTCRAWSTHGTVDMDAAITVVQPNELDGKPAIIAGRPEKDVHICVGEDVNISFRAQGEPKPKVLLMKGMRDISNSQRVCKMTSDDYVKFTLKRSVMTDAGTYCILARNAYGCDRAFVTVVVRQRADSESFISDWNYPAEDAVSSIAERQYKSVPERIPAEPNVVDGGSNWVSIAWPKPDNRYAAPVLAYKVESWMLGKEGGARWQELGITPLNNYDAFNLKPGEQYHFRVTPRNRYGWGESVQTSHPVGVGLAGDQPEFVDILPGQLKVLIGETANLSCSVKGDPTPEVVWMKNGHELEEGDGRVRSSFNGQQCRLSIEGVVAEDEARYSCEASNAHGRASTYARLAVVSDRLVWEADAKLKRERSAEVDGEYPPQFTMRLRDRRVQATYPVRLTCQVIGKPPPTVTWLKDAQPVTLDGRRTASQDEHFHTLEIERTTLEDGGVYEATARNNSGAVSCHCCLVVDKGIRAYVAPDFCLGLEPLYRLHEGEELRITAVVEAYPSVGVTWYRDGVRLRPSRRAVMTLDHDGQIELALAAVTPRDAGVYTCTASNEVGRVTTSGKVEVIGDATMEKKRTPPMVISPDVPYSKEPMFIRKPRSSEAREGDTVIIACEVIGDPKPDVYWLRDFLKPDYYRDATHFKRVGAGPEYRFEIPHAKLDYTGAYSVVAKNVHGEAKAIISLQIKVRDPDSTEEHSVSYGRVDVIPRFEREVTDLLCHDGDVIEFECRVTGRPEPCIRWFHYNELIRDCDWLDSSFEEGTARLRIKQVTAEDEGTYTCEAANDLGKATSSACLVVYPPGEPNTLSQQLRRPPALLSTASTPRSTPRSTPARSVSRTPGPDPRRLCSPPRQMAPKFYTYPFNKVVEEGESVIFQCAVKGLPAPWATWDKDGVVLTPSARFHIREKDDVLRILEIDDVTVDDVGVYRITLENDHGLVDASARLELITRSGKFHAGVRAPSPSPRRAQRRRDSLSRQD